MSLPYELARVSTVSEACALLADPARTALPVGGGTQLLPTLSAQSDGSPRLIDLSGIDELGDLTFDADRGLRIGAGVTLSRLSGDAMVLSQYPALADASRAVGTSRLRSLATIGGNLCQNLTCRLMERLPDQQRGVPPCEIGRDGSCRRATARQACWASYAGDLAPVLLALDATVDISSVDGDDSRPLHTLFPTQATGRLSLAPGELVRAIRIPPPAPHSGAAYVRLEQDDAHDYPLLGAAAAVVLDANSICLSARVVLTGVGRVPRAVPEADLLVGHWVTDTLLDQVAHAAFRRARPENSAWGYAVNHRVRMTRPFVGRALRSALAAAARQRPA